MNNCKALIKLRTVVIIGMSMVPFGVVWPSMSAGQTNTAKDKPSAPHIQRTNDPSPNEPDLANQIAQLRTKVDQLETILMHNRQAMTVVTAQPSGMGGATGAGTPMAAGGMMNDNQMEMGGMAGSVAQSGQGMGGMSGMGMGGMGGGMQSGQGMSRMGGMGMGSMGMGSGSMQSGQGMGSMSSMGMGMMGMEGMGMMGQMPGMGSMQVPSALPGFPGASHIYHIGATGFFLDHPEHVQLNQEQQAKLNQIKEQALLAQSTTDRWIAQGEQEIWVLTSSDSPDVSKIEAKVREIEKLRADKRMAFIRAVGEAAQQLTAEQRQSLVGHAPHGTMTAPQK